MPSPEPREKSNDYGAFTAGVVFVLIGSRFFTTQTLSTQERLFTAACLLFGAAILATVPRQMWRFSALCIAMLAFGGMLVLYGTLVLITGESGGRASQHVAHLSGLYPIVAGAVIAGIGFVLRTIYIVFTEKT